MSRWTGIILAGSRPGGDALAQAAGVSHKALIPIAGRAMVAHVAATLSASPEIGPMAVIGLGADEAAAAALPAATLLRPQAQGPSGSLSALLADAELPRPWLVTTADHPLLTPAMVAQFLTAVSDRGACIAAGLTPLAAIRARFPQMQRTGLRLADGPFSGCNLFALDDPGAAAALQFFAAIEADRKKPWRQARALGLATVARYLAGRLDRAGLERALTTRLAATTVLPLLDDPLAAVDVDKPADLAQVRALLEGDSCL